MRRVASAALIAFALRAGTVTASGCAAPLTVAELRDGGALPPSSTAAPPTFGEGGEEADGEGPVVSDPIDEGPIEAPLPDGDAGDAADGGSDGSVDASLDG